MSDLTKAGDVPLEIPELAEQMKKQQEYVTTIADYFLEKRGGAQLLSNLEYQTIRKWYDQGIPLRIVLRAMDDIYYAKNRPATNINSLRYFERPVEQAMKHWAKAVGE